MIFSMIEVKTQQIDRSTFLLSRLALDYGQEDLTFPADDLTKLEEQINRPRWTVPVLANGELIRCLRAAIRLAAASSSRFSFLLGQFSIFFGFFLN